MDEIIEIKNLRKSFGEGASAAEAKCREATREVKMDKEYERSVYDKFTAVRDGLLLKTLKNAYIFKKSASRKRMRF